MGRFLIYLAFFLRWLLSHNEWKENRKIPADPRQQIVEIMRDTAGQPADRLHFLRLPQLFLAAMQRLLRAFGLGDVLDNSKHLDGFAMAVHEDFPASLHHPFRSIR